MQFDLAYNDAYDIAAKIHAGVKRTGSDEAYITHPIAVAQILINYGRTQEEVIAGLLHDTVEDTTGNKIALLKKIEKKFGSEVTSIVYFVTKRSKKEDGNRATRVQIDIEHYLNGDGKSHNVKLADIMHNLSDVQTLDPSFARKYVREKDLLVQAIEKAGKADQKLLNDVKKLIEGLLIVYK